MNIVNKLIKLANDFDKKGLREEADILDNVLKKKAQEREKFDAAANKKYRIMHWTDENGTFGFSLIVGEDHDYRNSNSYQNAVRQIGGEKKLLEWTEQYTESFYGSIEEAKLYMKNQLGWGDLVIGQIEIV